MNQTNPTDAKNEVLCMAEDCARPVCIRGCCKMHYARLLRYGDYRTVKKVRHGLAHTTESQIWSAIKQRCYNPKTKYYPIYGGRGIVMCERWRTSFKAFYEDMGPRPSTKHSIDRIDNDKGYGPDNCRWATSVEQILNRRVAAPKSGHHNVICNRGKYSVVVKRNRITYYLGRFTELDGAIEAKTKFLQERGEL